ncbi:unnamed protein product [Adineta steineri]|uniref:Poly [ADP-ribose] polymerase n=3 Tax=Adineta steineri TaxID=433720 RepID=A0A819F7X8_9BILA|nr:unnamed protein product [Adineta steineri]
MKQVIQIETSDSSDDEKNTDGGKATKLKIADVAENDEHSSADEKEKNVTNKVSSKTKRKTKRTSNTKRKQNRPKSTSTSERSRRKTVQTGLNGNYWNVVQIDRNSTTSTYNSNQLNDDDDDDDDGNDSIYSSGREDDTKLQKILASSSSSSSEREVNLRTLLYSNRTFITCRSPEDSFFLCQVLQDVYNDTKRIRIRWCSLADENGDETKVDDKTHFKFDYEDTLDPKTVLTGIPHVTRHADNTISLKEPDIIETKRLLEKSIRGESLSSDEPMDLSTENNIKTSNKSTSDLSNDSLPIKEALKKIKKRKISPESSRKQPVKKKIRKMSGESTLKRRPTIDINDIEDDEKQILKTKKSPKKTVAKPTTTPKAQLFKVQSNRLLKENLTITTYRKEPFFEDDLSVPYVSSIVQSKLAIRAVLINDPILLKGLIDDVNRVCSVHVQRGLHNELTAIHYAIKTDNIELLKMLLEDLKTPKLDRCPFPTVTMTTRSTGRANIHAFGFRTAQIMASRGAKEGNNALNKDNMSALTIYHGQEIILYAIKNNCTRQIYDLLLEAYAHNNNVYENISHIVRGGYRKLAASIIGDIKDNTFYGFNNLHHQVLLFDGEDLTINRATSVVKKTKDNFQITPIHCAAINPNSKYLKQLLNVMPEYNILDKYERRPIHFAAACEGPEPLEFLLSKQVNFNDVDRGGNSPLHIAAMYGRAINAEILLRTAKEKAESNDAEDQIVHQKFGLASINRLNKTRFYPLHLAVVNNHLECVKVLLEFGANVDAPTSTSSGKLTPLMLACQKGYLKIVVHLIENGARVEARDRFKRTPLIHACMCGNAHIVSHLLRMGANANVCDSSLNTALHYSIAYGWYFCVRLLIEAGANVNCVNSWQTTCLAAGFLKGHYGICDYLLTDHHVDINFKTDDGLTLVMLTVGLDVSSSSVQQLDYVVTKHKADCTCVDSNGNNAFHYLASNISGQNIHYEKSEDEKAHHDNFFQIAQALFDHECEPNKLNNKAQSALMIALEAGNFLLVDYLINKAQVEINPDVSHDGKNLLHYFAIKCDEYDLIQTLIKLPINDEIKKMSQMFDNSGRTPFHYCTSKFNEFCLANKSADGTDLLKKQYQSIIQMIEYCLESVQCDPDLEIRSNNDLKKSTIEQIIDDEEQSNENSQPMDDTSDEAKISKPKETSIFSLLRTVSFASQHPLELFLTKTKNINVLHHETQRTPLLEAIYLQEYQTAHMLMKESSCDINLSTSIIDNERQQTPLILACKLQSLSIIRDLLNHKQCHILAHDNQQNQAIHYYLATSNRSNQYLDLLNLFIEKLKQIDSLNMSGKDERTPLHIAVYHNSGAIDSTTDVEEILIDNKCDLLIRDKLGNIPLHNIFLNKNIGDDPVELCVLILKAMKYESLDTKNNEGNTPLHLAVLKCSTVCITLLQQHKASLTIENNLSNSIIGTCIASGHLNLFITFLQQSIDIDLGKMHNILIKEILSETNQPNNIPTMTASFFPTMTPSRFPMRAKRVQLTPRLKSTQNQITTTENKLSKQDNNKETWIWKYADIKNPKQFKQYSLIYLIIERDWQGALSLILNDLERFHLSYIQVLEAAILKNKLNLVLRLLSRLKDKTILHGKNSHRQNLFHLLANMDSYDNDLFKQILLHIHEYHVDWNLSDKYGSYPIHYACVKQNFLFLSFLREKYPTEFSLNQLDTYDNPAISLLFWTTKTEINKNKIQSLVIYGKQLDCLCNYQNEIAMNPLSFGYNDSSDTNESYPPMKSDSNSTNIRTSPLINAIVHNNFQLVKFLLQLDTDVNFPDAEKRTPLMHAVRQNNIDIVKLLLNKDYSLEEKSDPFQGFPVHHIGQRLGRGKGAQNFFLGATAAAPISTSLTTSTDESKKFLVTSTIDLNASDPLGRTCIHHLVQPFPDGSYTSNIELLRLLHSSGASITQLDLAGLSPLQYGAINGCQHLCDELIKLINDETGSTQAIIERFYINDPNKNLLDQPDFYSDAQQLIDKYISKHPSHTQNTAYQVDHLSGMSVTGEVLIDTDKNEPYDVRLTKTDVNYGIVGLYNFYRMQIIKHKSKNNLYFLFTRWGRIGDAEGQYQLTPYSTLDECRKEFLKVFREKTGNAWKDTNQFEIKPKKYTLIKLNEREIHKYSNVPIDFEHLQTEHVSSKLHSSIFKDFLKTLINRQAIRLNIDKTQLDIEWMPVSQLKRETLQKARDLLIELKNNIEKKQELTLAIQRGKTIEQQNQFKSILDSIYKYTNEYYTIIPLRGYADEKLPIIDNEGQLKQQEKILDDLLELELSYKILLGAQANLKTISPLDYLYKSINCQFEAMNKDDIDSQLILRYIWASSSTIQVEQIFKVARPNEDERLYKSNLDNHYLLWHGTNICNLISILTRGLLAGPLAAMASGSLFGKGIYTADTFAKSLGYCSGVKQNDGGGERCFMILCEVALGEIKEMGLNNDDGDDGTKQLDLNQFQSRKGTGRLIPDPRYTVTRNYGVRMPLGNMIDNTDVKVGFYGLNYNEYIVYDESQVALRYLVQFRR